MYLNIENISEEDLIKNDKNTNFYSVRLINGMFFLLLIISSGFVGDILNCKYQRLVINNIYMKHLVAFLTLYFLNSNLFTDEDHPINKLPNNLKRIHLGRYGRYNKLNVPLLMNDCRTSYNSFVSLISSRYLSFKKT